jgi:hypothetical protein
MPKFKTTIMQAEDMNATGIVVPEEVVAKLGQVASAARRGASREGGREGRGQG